MAKRVIARTWAVRVSSSVARSYARSPPPRKKSRSMYYGEHGVVGFVVEGGESASFKTSTTFKRDFKPTKHKQWLRERGGRAVCQRWAGV